MPATKTTKTNRKVGPKEAEARKQRAAEAERKAAADATAAADAKTAAAAVDAKVTNVKPKTTTSTKSLSAADETKVADAVKGVFDESKGAFEPAIRYGRKLVKQSKGLRSSPPPRTGLSEAHAEKIRVAILGEPESTKEV